MSPHVPLHGGVALLNPKRIRRAAVGGIVTKGGTAYVTVNEHFARSREGGAGQPFLGYDSGGKWNASSPPAVVVVPYPGSTSKTEYMDVALCEALVPVSFDIPGIGIPTGVTAPRKGMKVIMSGAESGMKRGEVINPNEETYWGRVDEAGNPGTSVYYTTGGSGRTRIKNVFTTSIKSNPGDSGSWVIEEGTRKVVGIHFAPKSGTGERSVRADAVASVFGVSFVGRQGVIQPARTPSSPTVPPVTGVGSQFEGDLLRGDVTLPSNPLEAINALFKAKPQMMTGALIVGGITLVYLFTRGK